MTSSGSLRILVGTHEIVRQVENLAAGFRLLGHHVTSIVDAPSPFYPDAQYDLVAAHPRRGSRPHPSRRAAQLQLARHLPALVAQHDVFVFAFGRSLLPGGRDLPLLRAAGKTVVNCFLGSDVRHWSSTEQYRASVGLGTYAGYRDERSLDAALRTLRMAELFSDAVFMQPSFAELALAPYQHLRLAVDLTRYTERIPDRQVPVVVHAPSKRAIKGTAEILEALRDLRAAGVEFELRLLEGLPNDEVIRVLADADIVVDELNEAHYGMLGLESMASGCVVLCGNRPDVVPLPRDVPAVHIEPSTIRDRLRRVITDRVERSRLARAGRPFVERHHDRTAVAGTLLADVERARRGDHDYTPTFFRERYELPSGVEVGGRARRLTRRVAARLGVGTELLRDLEPRGLA